MEGDRREEEAHAVGWRRLLVVCSGADSESESESESEDDDEDEEAEDEVDSASDRADESDIESEGRRRVGRNI